MADETQIEKKEDQIPEVSTQETTPTDQEMAETALFQGDMIPGIPDDKVATWKNSYQKLFVFFHLGVPYVYRGFGYHEYKALRAEIFQILKEKSEQSTEENVPDDIFRETAMKKFVLWPENFAELIDNPEATLPDGGSLPAGIPYLIGEYLMAASGFTEMEPQIID